MRLGRVLIAIVAACATCLLLVAGPAAAQTAYRYEYSGQYIDGTGSTQGQFKTTLGGIDYQPSSEALIVDRSGEPGIINKFTKAGVPAKFSALNNGAGRDYIELPRAIGGAEVSVDKSSAASAGNIYLYSESFGGGTGYGYQANGLPIPAFNNEQSGVPGVNPFGGCGADAGPNGEYWDFTHGNGEPEIHRRNLNGNIESTPPEVTYLTEGTFGDPFMCMLKLDSQGNFYGLWEESGGFAPQVAVKLPPEPIANDSGGTAEKPPSREYRYRLNGGCCGIVPTNGNHSAIQMGIDRSDDDVFLAETSNEEGFGNSRVSLYDSKGALLTTFGGPEGTYEGLRQVGGVAVDPATHDVYISNNRVYPGEVRHIEKFVPGAPYTVPDTDTEQPAQPELSSKATLRGVVNPDGIETTRCFFEYGPTPSLGTKAPCSQGQQLNGSSDQEVTAEITGLTKGKKYWVKLFTANASGADEAQKVTVNGATGGTFKLTFGPNTTAAIAYNATAAEVQAKLEALSSVGAGNVEVSGAAGGPYTITFKGQFARMDVPRLIAAGVALEGVGASVTITVPQEGYGIADGGPEQFIAQSKAIVTQYVNKINTDGATFNGTVDPNGGRTWYHWEYGPTAAYGETTPEVRLRREDSTELELPQARTEPYVIKNLIGGLKSGTTYHFRLVARNEQGTATGPDQEFITYAQEVEPKCANSLVRQQTGSGLLLDCRAYELASTSYSGGHDVVSSTIPGEKPLTAYPDASGRLLYSLDSAVVPGVSGEPTNLGRDPYVAVRGQNGWTTEYVGLPSGGMADPGMFGSPLLEADDTLGQFAFGGEDICDPCFADGSTNIPLRRSNGSLEKGMAGSLNPAADPAGEVRRHFSEDGSTFVFGAEKKFDPNGNEGSVSIYSRRLSAGTTQVVSTMPNGNTMTGTGIVELDVSANGERVLIGQKVGEDGAGNEYFDLYMHEGSNPESVEVVNTAGGVVFNGMTADGSKVFFTTPAKLAGDTDSSNDFFVAEVGSTSATISRLSTGSLGTGDTDSCAPVGNWNVVSGGPNCGTVAIAGGGGVGRDSGTAYFLSPELLDGAENGVANQPNLYVVKPGQSPHFVATLESSGNPAIVHGVNDSGTHSYEDFQVTPDGRYAAFSSVLALTGYQNQGHSELYRYDSASDTLSCVSCAPTLAPALSDITLNKYGLNLTNDGRVFFNTVESYVLRDTNGKEDAYEWSNGRTQLISTGLGPNDSALLSVSADGKDAFFFTRDVLAPQDGNGAAVKVYDAREGGGFLVEQSSKPCAASDECHGAGTQQPGPPDISTATGEGTQRQPSELERCDALAAKAKKSSLHAEQLGRRARKAASPQQAQKLRELARKAAKQARKLRRMANGCRRSSGGGSK